ncbi:MAG: hypothetical protein QG675_13 [Patescibacteria group bacterium]|nr:hypothetical protein [Patescibacteria group bacterium]
MPEPTGPTGQTEPTGDSAGGSAKVERDELTAAFDSDIPNRLSEEDKPGDGNPVSSVEAQGFVQDPVKAHAMAKAEVPYRTLESGLREKGEDKLADNQAEWAVEEAEKAGEQYEKEKQEIQKDFKSMLNILTVACQGIEHGRKGVNLLGEIKSSIQETEVADTRQIAFDQFLDVVLTPEDKQIFLANLDRLHKKGGMGFPKFLRGTFEVPTKLGYSIKVARFAPDLDKQPPDGYGLPKPTYAIALVKRVEK